MQQRTLVEVRKSPKSTTWYNAEIINVKGDSIHVAFLDNVWPSRDTPAQSVRRRPQVEEEDDAFDPQVEDVVEVFFPASETNPSGWSLGSVSSIKTSFYFIGIVGNQRGPQDFIVERGSLRPCSTEPPLEEAQLSRRIVKVPRDLQEWVRSQDSLGCLSHVQKCGELLVAHCLMPEPGSKDPATILLVGDDHNLDLGEKLLAQIHFKNQQEMQKFHVQRERLLQRLEEWKQWFSTRNAEAFSVDQALVGLIVGKKGANINQVRDKYSVEVNVQDQKSGDGNSTVTIIGDTAEAVRKAREELEYITERLELKPERGLGPREGPPEHHGDSQEDRSLLCPL